MSKLRESLIFLFAVLMCLQVSLAVAQGSVGHRGVPIGAERLDVQDRADRVYERSDYDRAFLIYRNELAQMGDKYGQYMVGYMYLTGKGVEADSIAASAWYRLAAERGGSQYVAVSDGLWLQLDAAQQSQSDEQFVKLRKQFSDLAIVMKAIRADRDLLRSRTGSRLGGKSSALQIIDPNDTGAVMLEEEYYGKIEDRMMERLRFVALYIGADIVVDDPRRFDISGLEKQLGEFLSKLN